MDKDLNFEEEETEEFEDELNWKGIAIASIVIVAICALITLAIIILTPYLHFEDDETLELNEILDGNYLPKLFNGSWISGHEFIYHNKEDDILMYDVIKNGIKKVVDGSLIREYTYDLQEYSISADKLFLLLTSSISKSKYFVHKINSNQLIPLENVINIPYKIQLASWSSANNSIIFVANNDLFYLQGIGHQAKRITNNGKQDAILNGIFDWLYTEQIFGKNEAFWSSNDGKHICYAVTNETQVPVTPILYYQYRDNSPEISYQKYPKAGETIPKVSLWIANVEKSTQQQLVKIQNDDNYLSHVKWINDKQIVTVWAMRSHNYLSVVNCQLTDLWICKEVKTLPKGVKDLKGISKTLMPINNQIYYYIDSRKTLDKINSYHIAVFNKSNKYGDVVVTNGSNNELRFLSVNLKSQLLFYEVLSEQNNIFQMNISTNNHICLTCDSYNCHHYNVIFSPTSEYFIFECFNKFIPKVMIRNTFGIPMNYILEDNSDIEKLLKYKSFPLEQTITTHSNKNEITIKLLEPSIFNGEDKAIKYPLIFKINEPGENTKKVTNFIDWPIYLTTKLNYLYGYIQLTKFKNEFFNSNLFIENMDNHIAASNLFKHLPFVRNICLLGSSYSSLVILSILASNKAINCAIIYNGVFDLNYMDSVSTEQYFGMDKMYFSQINSSQLISKIKNKNILLIHGTSNQNVHVYHAMQFIQSFIKVPTIKLRIQLYPDQDDPLNNQKRHFYKIIQEFLTNH